MHAFEIFNAIQDAQISFIQLRKYLLWENQRSQLAKIY